MNGKKKRTAGNDPMRMTGAATLGEEDGYAEFLLWNRAGAARAGQVTGASARKGQSGHSPGGYGNGAPGLRARFGGPAPETAPKDLAGAAYSNMTEYCEKPPVSGGENWISKGAAMLRGTIARTGESFGAIVRELRRPGDIEVKIDM
ncbi:MAG: hypothetical protein LBR87_08355 [Synergistaceae bacterium]|jgi:hypothetical protein|nr:hypothetical protein [Synergistaceae bacterium]